MSPPWQLDWQIRASQHDERHEAVYVSEAVPHAHRELDLVVGLDARVGDAELDGPHDGAPVAARLLRQVDWLHCTGRFHEGVFSIRGGGAAMPDKNRP